MTDPAGPRAARGTRRLVIGVAAGIVATVAAANAHLVYVSLASQPDCVPHLKSPDGSGSNFRAAKSAC